MKLGQLNVVVQNYLNEHGGNNLYLGREDNAGINSEGDVVSGSDGISVPKLHVFTVGDGENVILKTDDLDLSGVAHSGSSQNMLANGTNRRVGICPHIELVGDDYIRDNGIRIYSEENLEVWGYFSRNNNSQYYGTGWRKIMEINPERAGYEGFTDIPFIDYYGNHTNSSGGVGMMMSIAFQCDVANTEIKVISIPDGASGTYDRIGGSDAAGEIEGLLDMSGGKSYIEWDHSVKPFGVKYHTLTDKKERYDNTFLIEDISAATNASTIGNNYSWQLNTTQKIQNAVILADDLYAVQVESFSSTEDNENPGSFINMINFKLSSLDGNGEEQLSESGMTYKVYIDLDF